MARILLLEADRQLAGYTASFFSRQGHKISRFSDPQSAITSTDAGLPDIIILNLSLAGRSGIEFLYELRSYSDWQSVPAIVIGRLSPDEQAVYAESLTQLNASAFLPKENASLEALAEAVARLQPLVPA